MKALLCILFCLIQATAFAFSFDVAKKKLKQCGADCNPMMTTIYCGCDFEIRQNAYKVSTEKCGYNAEATIQIEHIVPLSILFQKDACYNNPKQPRSKNRADCEKEDKAGDLHNLIQSIDRLNVDRQNYSFGILDPDEPRYYGKCDFEVHVIKNEIKVEAKDEGKKKDKNKKKEKKIKDTFIIEPRPEIRGFIARTYLYMYKKYKFHLPQKEQNMFREWNKLYPVQEWECKRDKAIAELQGDHNSFIANAEICTNVR